MIISLPRLRRIAGVVARAGVLASASMLAVTLWATTSPHLPNAQAAVVVGAAQVITPGGGALGSGGSATQFSLKLPDGAACTGDSANGGYRVQSYIAAASVDPNTLQFDESGPIPNGVGAAYRQPLLQVGSGDPYVNFQTANATVAGGPGPVINIPTFTFSEFVPGDIPPGTYNIGIACTLGPPSATQLDKRWGAEMVFATAAADTPAGVTWTAAAAQVTSTTLATSTTTTTRAGTTTTTAGGTTTTTRAGTTTTTGGGTTTSAAGGVTATNIPSSTTALSRTGGISPWLLVWSALLLIFGRMVVLVTRSPEVRSGGRK